MAKLARLCATYYCQLWQWEKYGHEPECPDMITVLDGACWMFQELEAWYDRLKGVHEGLRWAAADAAAAVACLHPYVGMWACQRSLMFLRVPNHDVCFSDFARSTIPSWWED